MKIGIYNNDRLISQIIALVTVVFSSVNCQNITKTPADDKSDPAKVENVIVSGSDGKYSFSVTLRSPDTGCDQYANWWEVISTDGGTLYYRRILAHSHVSEQPFTRSGGIADIDATTEIIIRAHMHPSGYSEGSTAMKGSVSGGFVAYEVPDGFGKDLEKIDPQPNGCAF